MAQATRRARTRAGEEAPKRAGAPAGDAAATGGPMCSVAFCPICTMVAAVGEVRPELTEHLLAAGREVLLAMRALIDTRLESMDLSHKLERVPIQ